MGGPKSPGDDRYELEQLREQLATASEKDVLTRIDKARRERDAEATKNDANPKAAFGDKKVPLHLVPPALLIGAARAFAEGAAKYGPYNWRKTKVEAMTYVGAMLRHLMAYVDGEDTDPESSTGKKHLEGIAASLAVLMDAQESGYLIDNRPPPGAAPRLVLTPGAANTSVRHLCTRSGLGGAQCVLSQAHKGDHVGADGERWVRE